MNKNLKNYNKEYLENFRNKCNNKERFDKDINAIDFELLQKIWDNLEEKNKEGEITPVTPLIKGEIQNEEEYIKIGKKIVDDGEFALITMAGGQGTRLGHDKPKGTYYLTDKSLFEIIADNIRDKNIIWLIMTSEENHDDTVSFFEKNSYFGITEVRFFKQCEVPLFHSDGKILINEEGFIKFAADGNGGVYNSLEKSGLLNLLKDKGVKYTFLNGVDNVLTNPVDYTLIGLMKSKNVELACKSVVKRNLNEPVGAFCYNDNLPHIVEYINLPEEMRSLTDEKGNLIYADSNIVSNLLSVSLLEKIVDKPLKYNKAIKKISYMSENGEIIKPTEPNAYKFETFMFDGFKYTNDYIVLRVKREDEFAPIKNSDETGVDCPNTARKLYEDFLK